MTIKQRQSSAYNLGKGSLVNRQYYDLSDYGIIINKRIEKDFSIGLSRMDDKEIFLFFFPNEKHAKKDFALYNLHCFLKQETSLEDFAHNLGESMKNIKLSKTTFHSKHALTYERLIELRNLFEGAEHIIDFIGGEPSMTVRDSHTYFLNQHRHYYTGMLHTPGNEEKYDQLRQRLFSNLTLLNRRA